MAGPVIPLSLVLANQQYHTHMTDEGLQLQLGLQSAGWTLVGPGYDENTDVRRILREYQPTNVFVQDKRDWDPDSGCHSATPDLKYKYLNALATSDAKVSVVVKDAGPDDCDYHRHFCEETDADGVVIYYHPLSVLKFSPWLQRYRLVRIHHSIHPDHIPTFNPASKRFPVCGSGAIGARTTDVYPLRARIAERASQFGMIWLKHPGYKNTTGPDTPKYLTFLNSFKVSFATASSYGFSLRKIIESVACGCTVVTDLPSYDVLPEIDRALVRITPDISDTDLKLTLSDAVASWDEAGRRLWAEKAIRYYSYINAGIRLSHTLTRL